MMTRTTVSDRHDPARLLEMLQGVIETTRLTTAAEQAPPVRRIPMTVVCGFLGAGKTTFVNYLISQSDGARLAVLVNDFGSVNIDAALIRSQSADAMELTNGCVCCSISGRLAERLVQLTTGPSPPDAIILETSGLADPRPLMQLALANAAIALDCVLTLVDAESAMDRFADPACRPIMRAQLFAADIVVLNKTDLVGAAGLDVVRAAVTSRARTNGVVEAVQGRIPLELVLSVQSPARSDGGAAPAMAAGGFESVSLFCSGVLDAGRFETFIREIPSGILRAKGVLRLSDKPENLVLYQQVGRRWSRSPTAAPLPGGRSTLVLIGPTGCFNAGELGAKFAECGAASR